MARDKFAGPVSVFDLTQHELKKLIEANPTLKDKQLFPHVRKSRLRELVNQRSQPHLLTICFAAWH